MRNSLLLGLLIFTIVASIGYCIVWFDQSSQMKKAIEQAVAQINSQQKYVTYDAIETSGFPTELHVSIVNPHFSGQIDKLLKEMAAKAHPNQPIASQPMPQWNEDFRLNGRIVIGINMLSDHYSLRVSGNSQRTATIGNQTISIASESASDTVCALQMTRSGNALSTLWNYQGFLRNNASDFIRDLRLLDCNSSGGVISNATNNEKLVSNGPWRIYVVNQPAGEQQQIRLYSKVIDMEVTPQGDAILSLQRGAISPGFSTPAKYSLFGKQNLEVDFSYAGPSDWKADKHNMPLNISLDKFDVTNQIHTSNMTFFLTNTPSGNNRSSRLAFKAEENFAEPYDTFVQDVVHNFVGEIYASNVQQAPWQGLKLKYKPDELYALISPAIPNFHSLGKTVISLDTGFQGAGDFSSGDVTLTDLEISTSPYGIKGSGTAKRTDGQPFPEGHMLVTCSNCTRLVDDVISYIARAQKTLSYFQTPQQAAASTPIDPSLAEGLKNFLKALAAPVKDTDPDKNSFVYVINSDKTVGVTVNNRQFGEVMSMYNQYVGPTMAKPQQPAANVAPPPPASIQVPPPPPRALPEPAPAR
jgi:hypothetical protein